VPLVRPAHPLGRDAPERQEDYYGRVVPMAERVEGQRLYTSHFATCPNAKQHRNQ
jgi:hypothetical protein